MLTDRSPGESRKRWVDYSRAKDVMFEHTDLKKTPWFVDAEAQAQAAEV
jgi:polyphosphate kinase 2 (PPK2 family)